MKRNIIKLSALFLLVGSLVAMAGCGKEKADEGDRYVYNYSSEVIKMDVEKTDTYPDARFLNYKDGKVYYLETQYDQDYNVKNVLLHIKNISDNSVSNVELESFKDNSGYISYTFVKDDTLTIITEYYSEDGESQKTILTYDMAGKIISKQDLTPVIAAEGIDYFYNVCKGPNGEFYLAADACVLVVDKDCKKIAKITGAQWINNIYSINGDVYASGYFDDDSNFKKIDMDKKAFSDVNIGHIGNNASWYEGKDNKVFLSTENMVYLKDLTTGQDENLWSWIDIDYANVTPEAIWANEDGSYEFIINTYSDEDNCNVIEKVIVKRELETAANAKTRIVYGCTYLDSGIRKLIIDFNKKSDKYKIVVKDYSEEYGYEGAMEMMNADIARGGVLDVVTLDNLDNSLVSKKAFVDLAPLIEKDTDIDKSDLFTNIIDAGKLDGKLFFASPRFYVTSMIGNSDYVGNKDGWTVEEFAALREKYPDKEFISYASSSEVLSYMLMFAGSDFIDYAKSTCSFNSDDFKNILKVASTFRDEFEYSDDYDEWKMIQQGDIILSPLSIYDFDTVTVYKQLFSDKGNVIGFPCADGKGHSVMFTSYTSILSNSKHQDGAWEFVKGFFDSNSSSDNYYGGFPISRSKFEARAKEAVESSGGGGWSNGSTTIEFTGATQEVVDFVREIIESANRMTTFNDKVYEMVAEEAEPFFKGQKTVDEVCDIIQSRISIYLAETK